jgi:hypothetical protein
MLGSALWWINHDPDNQNSVSIIRMMNNISPSDVRVLAQILEEFPANCTIDSDDEAGCSAVVDVAGTMRKVIVTVAQQLEVPAAVGPVSDTVQNVLFFSAQFLLTVLNGMTNAVGQKWARQGAPPTPNCANRYVHSYIDGMTCMDVIAWCTVLHVDETYRRFMAYHFHASR